MSEETKDVQSHEAVKTRRRSRHGFFTGVLVGGLLGLVLAGGLATATMAAGGSMLARMHGHGGRGGHGAALHDPEKARERAELSRFGVGPDTDDSWSRRISSRRAFGATRGLCRAALYWPPP